MGGKKGKIAIIFIIIILLLIPLYLMLINNDADIAPLDDNEPQIVNDLDDTKGNTDPDNDSNDEKSSDKNSTSDNDLEVLLPVIIEGYCYNPDYPELGPSYENYTINIEEDSCLSLGTMIHLNWTFVFTDDKVGVDPENTGDVFVVKVYCYNKTDGRIIDTAEVTSFAGGGTMETQHYCDADGRGPYFDVVWYIDIQISDCGEYLGRGPDGLGYQPDTGNDWTMELEFTFIPIS